MSLLSSNGELILLHNNLKNVKKAKAYDLLLSPQFYFVKREAIPVKYAFQAKKLAPSIMEDILPYEEGYEYIVKKDGDSWLIFAYRPKEIELFLNGCCQIPSNKINKIYFADQLKDILKKAPVGVDENFALTLIDDYATIVPRAMVGSDKYIRFSKKLRPDSGYKFKPSTKVSYDSTINKSTIIASILIVLLAAAFIVEGISYKKAANKEFDTLNSLFEEYPQLRSKLTRNSIKEKYKKIEKRQRSIRETIKKFSQISSKKSILNNLKLEKDSLKATYNVSTPELRRVKAIAKEENLKISKVSGNTITLEGALK